MSELRCQGAVLQLSNTSLRDAATWVNLSDLMLSKDNKRNILNYSFILTSRTGTADLCILRSELWLPRGVLGGVRGILTGKGHK